MTTHVLPALGPVNELSVPSTVERTLPNGLTVLAIRRSSETLEAGEGRAGAMGTSG